MESTAYKELVEKIDRIAGYVRESERSKKGDGADVWLCNEEVMSLLGISRRTLQRLRDGGRIRYAIFRGACRYHFSEVERMVAEQVGCKYAVALSSGTAALHLEDFKRNYLLRTGGRNKKKG